MLLGDPVVLLGDPVVLLGGPVVLLGGPVVLLGGPVVLLGDPVVLLGGPVPEEEGERQTEPDTDKELSAPLEEGRLASAAAKPLHEVQ